MTSSTSSPAISSNSRLSLAKRLTLLPRAKREAWLNSLTEAERAALVYSWKFWARPSQLPPRGNWFAWLVLAGRGFGKTRTGAEWVRYLAENAVTSPIALVGATVDDVRKAMIEEDSGLLRTAAPWCRPEHQPSKRRIVWPNGVVAYTYSAEEPDRMRGPNHGAAWCDELASWRNLDEMWANLQFTLRKGNPQVCITTTPKPRQLLIDLVENPETAITKGSSYENRDNLSERYFSEVIVPYEGTRLGRQEIEAEILTDLPGALWKRDQIDKLRRHAVPDDIVRIVVSVDPSGSVNAKGDSQGITVQGKTRRGTYALLEDGTVHTTPSGWAAQVSALYDKWSADLVVAETNYGGEMVRHTLQQHDPRLPVKVITASRGKAVRAEPVAMLYERGLVEVCGKFPELEDQMCAMTTEKYEGRGSPDRLDAHVWGMTELYTGKRFIAAG